MREVSRWRSPWCLVSFEPFQVEFNAGSIGVRDGHARATSGDARSGSGTRCRTPPSVACRAAARSTPIPPERAGDVNPAGSAVDSHPADFDVRAVGLSGAVLGYRSGDFGAGG